jgi:hypothetical protein
VSVLTVIGHAPLTLAVVPLLLIARLEEPHHPFVSPLTPSLANPLGYGQMTELDKDREAPERGAGFEPAIIRLNHLRIARTTWLPPHQSSPRCRFGPSAWLAPGL